MGRRSDYSSNQYGSSPDSDVQIMGPGQDVLFDFEDVLPPSAQYIDQADFLLVGVYSNANNLLTTVNWRILSPQGNVEIGQQVLVSLNGPQGTFTKIALRQGFLLGVSVIKAADGANQNYLYATFGILRGATATNNLFSTLGQGYSMQNAPLMWPNGNYTKPEEGPGLIRSLTVAAPGAGVDVTMTVPNGERWQLLSMQATLTTAVAVANRFVQLTVDNSVNVFYSTVPGAVQIASLAVAYTFAPVGFAPAIVNGSQQIHYDNTQRGSDLFRFRTLTNGLQAADQWSNQQLCIAEWQSHT